MEVNRIHLMIHKDGLVPAGVYKAEGFFKAYDVYVEMGCSSAKVTKTYHKNDIVKVPHDTYCLFYEKLSLEFNLYLIEMFFNSISKPKRVLFLDSNIFTLNKVIGKDKVQELYEKLK